MSSERLSEVMKLLENAIKFSLMVGFAFVMIGLETNTALGLLVGIVLLINASISLAARFIIEAIGERRSNEKSHP